MFEARLNQAVLLRRLLEAVKELVEEANFDCNSSGISLQAMDPSHVALVALHLKSSGFAHYRADRSISLGINLGVLHKYLKCAASDDSVTLKAEDAGDVITLMFESQDQKRISEFDLKLMTIDSEHLSIPDADFKCMITMPSGDFKKICSDLAQIGDTVIISATKQGVKFAVSGDLGSGNVTLRQSASADDAQGVKLKIEENITQTYAINYLNDFSKATPISETVTLGMSPGIPLMVEYKLADGYIRYYLAPKIEENDQ